MLRKTAVFFIQLVIFLSFTDGHCKPQTICLNMIVKNESHVIEASLNSVKEWIDYWVIVDTGSTDGTQKIIRNCLKGIPGELHEQPWVNFEHNRNGALKLAKNKSDYILFMDADEVVSCPSNFRLPKLTLDSYDFTIRQVGQGIDYKRVLLIKNAPDWEWKGVVHETISCPRASTRGLVPEVVVLSYTTGFRSKDPQKYLKDALLLKEALKTDPSNARYVYYLAQSYLNVPDLNQALKYFERRATMGGWDQEVFFSLYCAAKIKAALAMDPEAVLKSYIAAHVYRPTRAEPLYHAAQFYLNKGEYFVGGLIAERGLAIPVSSDAIYVEPWIYEWGLLLQHAQCCFYLQKYVECERAIEKLLTVPTLPQDERSHLLNNLQTVKGLLHHE